MHGNIDHWHWLFELFPDYQLLLCDAAGDLLAVGHTLPLIWDGSLSDLPTTMEAILLRAEQAHRQGQAPTSLSAMAAMVSSGLSRAEPQRGGDPGNAVAGSPARLHGLDRAGATDLEKSLSASAHGALCGHGNEAMARRWTPGSVSTGAWALCRYALRRIPSPSKGR